MKSHIFTSESVTEGHPDKVCDQIADAILDEVLKQDPESRVACEVTVSPQLIVIMGEVRTSAQVDYEAIARETIKKIGYARPEYGFDDQNCMVLSRIRTQSTDIAQGVDTSIEAKDGVCDEMSRIGAGDQGMMFGYACNETPELMPFAIATAHKLCERMAQLRKQGIFSWMRPDGKAQVTIEYDGEGRVERCPAIVVSTQHDPDISIERLRKCIAESVIYPCLPRGLIDKDTKIYINPTGRFVQGGPDADSGLTGRKIIVDTYGGRCPHGGGSFSGKDATKMDRSGAYMARYIAKNIVAAGLAKRCTIGLAYAIGVANPVSVIVDSEGTGVVSDRKLEILVGKVFDVRPASIILTLGLRKPIFKKTASYGHFGENTIDYPWENTDAVNKLKQLCWRV